jgi:putative transposase
VPRRGGKQFNERSGRILNRARYPSDVVALVVFWRLRYKLSLRDLPEMFLVRGIEFSYEAVRDWEAKLTPSLIDSLRRRRNGRIGRSWYVDETYIKVQGRWCPSTRRSQWLVTALRKSTEMHQVKRIANTDSQL